MRISKKLRAEIYKKYDGKCAYSGTDLLPDWQVDHVEPLIRHPFGGEPLFPDAHNINNMVPCQRVINKYKAHTSLETFRTWLLGELHLRLAKYPKKSQVEETIKRKERMFYIASLFGITPEQPFKGIFYFEILQGKQLVTNWHRFDPKAGQYVFNHREDGWNRDNKPTPTSTEQQIWNTQKWTKVIKVAEPTNTNLRQEPQDTVSWVQ